MNNPKHSNRLALETSPYLLQHAHNPVDWYPWCDEALARARSEDKPILLSIGYSACHWCHVMEHESFEDEAVARVMNDRFVCIKVDREERPDLDKIYQIAHQMLTQRPGGWPLNMFLTPDDHTPFFGGTYFPKTPRLGMPGFVQVLERVAGFYKERRADIERQNIEVRSIFARLEQSGAAPASTITREILERGARDLLESFEPRYGGFGQAPKFPHPTSLDFLLTQWANGVLAGRADGRVRQAFELTLTAMAKGGLYDQLGGGFCRYSVDEQWMIPHFEKMLYDNAQLLFTYTDAFQATRLPLFRRIALETGEWTMREMQSPAGGYYSTLDADSEGHEGKFYVWDVDEMRALLSAEEWDLVEMRFGLTGEPNFEGRWHLNVRADLDAIADRFQITEAEVEERLASARRKLFNARVKRVHPGRDEKILTSWNGLMIRAMAHAGRLLDRADFIASAERAFDFVRANLWRNDRLLATYRDVQVPFGEANTALPREPPSGRHTAHAGGRERPTTRAGKSHLNAYLDDYVFFIDGGLALLEARWRGGDLEFLCALADILLARFEDQTRGGFFFTSDDHETLVHRPKPTSDDAIPSGNGVAARVLLVLGHLLGKTEYLEAAERTLQAMYDAVAGYPAAHGSLLIALDYYLSGGETLVLRGTDKPLKEWQDRAARRYAPRRFSLAIPADAELSGLLAERRAQGEVTAYLCAGQTCSAPISNFKEFDAALAKRELVLS